MKTKYVCILAALLLFSSFSLSGQRLATGDSFRNTAPPENIHIRGVETAVSGDSLRVNFHIRVAGIDLRTYQRLKLELSIRKDDRQAILPSIIYSGRLRSRYDRRNEQLSSSAREMAPYRLYTGIREREIYELEYKVNTPYARWMDHASLMLRQTFDSNGFTDVDEQVLAEKLNLVIND